MGLGKNEKVILDELSFGDMQVGFLLSSCSTKRMFQVARKRARSRKESQVLSDRKKNIKRALDALKKKKMVSFSSNGDDQVVNITSSGEEYVKKEQLYLKVKNKKNEPLKWDKHWRMVMFDVPAVLSADRYQIRTLLVKCGFVQVQQSVYLFPYDCVELVEYLEGNKRLSKYCHFFIGKYGGDDEKLRKLFGV